MADGYGPSWRHTPFAIGHSPSALLSLALWRLRQTSP